MQENNSPTNAKQALVALGANLPSGDVPPFETVRLAMDRLEERTGQRLKRSRPWRTPAFPPGAGPDFINAAVAFDWDGTPQTLLDLLHEVEAQFGRTRATRWEARSIDLDLLALGDMVLPDPATFAYWAGLPTGRAAQEAPDRLILPHPRLAERAFVLAPLADVALGWRHPVLRRTVAEMLADLPPETMEGVAPAGGG